MESIQSFAQQIGAYYIPAAFLGSKDTAGIKLNLELASHQEKMVVGGDNIYCTPRGIKNHGEKERERML